MSFGLYTATYTITHMISLRIYGIRWAIVSEWVFKNRKLFLRKHRIKKKLEKENKALFIEEMVVFFGI